MSLIEDLGAVLPTHDPLTADRLQLISREQYKILMGPMHETKFSRMASFHEFKADGTPDVTTNIKLNLPYFLNLWWPEDADIATILRTTSTDDFLNVTAYRRMTPTMVRIVMSIGETVTSNFLRQIFYSVGTRTMTQEARPKRVPIAISRGWYKVYDLPNAHGRYELELDLSTRPVLGHHVHPVGADPGRK